MSTTGLHPRKQAWLVGLLQEGGASGGEHLLLEIPGDMALLHLDVIDDIEKVVGLLQGGEGGAGGHFLLEVLGDIAQLHRHRRSPFQRWW